MSRDLLTTSTCEECEQLAECLTPQHKKLNHTEQSDPSKGCNANCRSCLLVPHTSKHISILHACFSAPYLKTSSFQKKLNHTEQSDPSKGCNAKCRSCLLVPHISKHKSILHACFSAPYLKTSSFQK